MPGFYTEADYENSIIELFQNMGYRYVYAPDLERDFSCPLYETELDEALRRINPDMTQAVEDGATRPVYYESRVIKLNLDQDTLKLIDRFSV